MKVIAGRATQTRFSVVVRGDGDHVSSSPVAAFLVDGCPVELCVDEKVIHINDGDEVWVAGTMKRGSLHARAYVNGSNGVSGRCSTSHLYFVGIVLTLTGIFAIIGIWVIYHGLYLDSTYAASLSASAAGQKAGGEGEVGSHETMMRQYNIKQRGNMYSVGEYDFDTLSDAKKFAKGAL